MSKFTFQCIIAVFVMLALNFCCTNETEHSLQHQYPDRLFLRLFSTVKKSLQHQLSTHDQKEFIHVSCSAGADRGLFVRLLNPSGERGCVGFVRGVNSLEKAAGIAAIDAACYDPRYPHITPDELQSLEIEITIIGTMKPIHDYTDFQLGRDTVMVKQWGKAAVIQGQIATGRNWTKEQYLEAICLKAGLDRDAYNKKYIEIYKAPTIFRKMKYDEISTDK